MAKQFTWRRNKMSKEKMVISLAYGSTYVLDTEDAVLMLQLMARAEKWEEKYHAGEGDAKGYHSYHCYAQDPSDNNGSARVIANTAYQVAKMAGKPEGR